MSNQFQMFPPVQSNLLGGRSRPRGLQVFLPFLHPSLLGNLPDVGPERSNSCEVETAVMPGIMFLTVNIYEDCEYGASYMNLILCII